MKIKRILLGVILLNVFVIQGCDMIFLANSESSSNSSSESTTSSIETNENGYFYLEKVFLKGYGDSEHPYVYHYFIISDDEYSNAELLTLKNNEGTFEVDVSFTSNLIEKIDIHFENQVDYGYIIEATFEPKDKIFAYDTVIYQFDNQVVQFSLDSEVQVSNIDAAAINDEMDIMDFRTTEDSWILTMKPVVDTEKIAYATISFIADFMNDSMVRNVKDALKENKSIVYIGDIVNPSRVSKSLYFECRYLVEDRYHTKYEFANFYDIQIESFVDYEDYILGSVSS